MGYETTIEAATHSSLARWLLAQHRDDAVGILADAARRDASFPRDGDFQAISRRLNTLGADAEMHEALDAAELDWLAY
jgi:uncharacterized protein YozE (UPF0346 family)